MSGVTAGALAACESASSAVSAASGAGSVAAGATYIPGTYEATAAGINGDVKVTMTFTENAITDVVLPQIEQAEEAGCFFKADTLEELADKLGFTGTDKETFLATVERYNELYDQQNDEDFGKPAYRLSAIRKAPFYGCWLGASLLTTEQGIAINENCQALDTNNEPMPGLYITGDMSGSFFANNYPCLMAGVACGRTMTFAIKAIKQMAGIDNV